MTQNIYEVITQDLLEHYILPSILEPLPLSDLIAQTHILPLGVLLHEELEELEVYLKPNYLPYFIDSVYMTTTSTTAKTLFLNRTLEQEGPVEKWNTEYPQRPSPYSLDIPPIWGNTQNTTSAMSQEPLLMDVYREDNLEDELSITSGGQTLRRSALLRAF